MKNFCYNNGIETKGIETETEVIEMKRRKNHNGTLISKGKGKPYLMKVVYGGKAVYKSSGETDRRKAQAALVEWSKTFQAKSDIAVLNGIQAQIKTIKDEQEELRLAGNGILVEDIGKVYFELSKAEGRTLSDKTYHLQSGILSAFVVWMSENYPKVKYAKYITEDIAQDYMDYKTKTLGNMTYNLHLKMFRRVFKVIADTACISHNPFDEIKIKHLASSGEERESLRLDDVKTILQTAYHIDYITYVGMMISAFCGLRIEDVSNLKWGQIDFDDGTLSYIPLKTRKCLKKPIVFPMSDDLKTALLKLKKTDSEYNDFVFGTRLESIQDHFKHQAQKIFDAAGYTRTMKDSDGKRKTVNSWHSFRHFFVSYCLNVLGMREIDVMHLVGHKSLQMITTIYHSPDYDILGQKLKLMKTSDLNIHKTPYFGDVINDCEKGNIDYTVLTDIPRCDMIQTSL